MSLISSWPQYANSFLFCHNEKTVDWVFYKRVVIHYDEKSVHRFLVVQDSISL